jgi:hypothetical protein
VAAASHEQPPFSRRELAPPNPSYAAGRAVQALAFRRLHSTAGRTTLRTVHQVQLARLAAAGSYCGVLWTANITTKKGMTMSILNSRAALFCSSVK